MVEPKIILITGASSGIGKATAKRLIKDGLTLYVAARRVEAMKELEDLGATIIEMDITEDDEIVAAISKIDSEHDGVDVLVNNAGIAVYGAIEDVSIEDARKQFEVNMFGMARLTQLVLPAMRKKGSGTIINVSSVAGKTYTPMGAWYHASKHAVEGWSDCLRMEVEALGIDVVIIEPGGIKTEFGDNLSKSLMKRSGNTAYASLAEKIKRMSESFDKDHSSSPDVVANVISKAIKAQKPNTRYHVGYMSSTGLFIRKWLSDRMFDKVIRMQLK